MFIIKLFLLGVFERSTADSGTNSDTFDQKFHIIGFVSECEKNKLNLLRK